MLPAHNLLVEERAVRALVNNEKVSAVPADLAVILRNPIPGITHNDVVGKLTCFVFIQRTNLYTVLFEDKVLSLSRSLYNLQAHTLLRKQEIHQPQYQGGKNDAQ